MVKEKQIQGDILCQIVDCVKETLFRAKLSDKPFILGFAAEYPDSKLLDTIEKNTSTFEQLGAVEMDWRDDGLRGKTQIAGEELLVSVQGVHA